jgi:hypothetical protein
MTDRLTLARALEEGGIAREAAEHIATEIFDAIHDNVATKADVAAVRAEVAAGRVEIAALRTELKGDIALVEHRLITRLGGAIAVAAGIILAAMRYLPHG